MKTTIITSAIAVALSVSASAQDSSTLGLSGDISVAYQSQFEFRGLTGIPKDYLDIADRDADVIIGDVNAAYGFSEN